MIGRRADPARELHALERRARALGQRIGAPEHAYPPFGEDRDGGYPAIHRRGGAWWWEVHERGVLLEQRRSTSEDDALYWILVHVTRSMASAWELRHRVPGTDTRIGWAGRQLALLTALDPRWAERFRREERSWLSTVDLPAQLPPLD